MCSFLTVLLLKMSGSRIFRRNRALGYVSNEIPSVVRYVARRKDSLIVTCIGRAFQIYTASHFRLLQVSGVHPDEITCLATDKYCIYAASDKSIYAWRAGRQIKHILKGHSSNVHLMLPFREHLVSVDEDNVLKVWTIRTGEVYLEIPFRKKEFEVTAIAHPPTYLNKILIGSSQGSLQLWNIKENKLVYSFASRGSKVTALEPSPAINVCGVGYRDGTIVLLNLKFDEVVMEFKQDWGMVTGISFRTDDHPLMATSSNNGNTVFWNLEERKIVSQLTAHHGSVTTTRCFPGEPLMLTTSPDNSMKLWIFDMPDGGARLLRIREGHSAPPLCIRYHGSNGENILSSGEDSSMRIFSTLSETLNKSMGRASYNRKASKKRNFRQEDPLVMPPITYFTTETTREKEWDNIAAIHSGLVQTTTWSFHKCKMGELRLVPEQFQNKNRKDFNTEAATLTLTHCGNFVIIGYSSGDVERFNIQSGIHRAKYGHPAHKAAVRGLACDNLNQFVITGSSDCFIKFWNFQEDTKKPIARIELDTGVTMFRSHRESAMLCVAGEDFSVNIIDCDTKNVVRKFNGHTATINDATFSPDSRWLITAAMDATIKIWDIPSSYLVDHFRVERPCISLTMSPTGDFLATAHVNYLGVFLWANKSIFSHLSLRSIDPTSEAPYIDLPSQIKDTETLESAMENVEIGDGEELDVDYETPDQIEDDMITISNTAASKWQNVLDLDLIKKRNKPKMPLKAPKQAPFFLPTVAGTEFKFDLSNSKPEEDNSKILAPESFNNFSPFSKLLNKLPESGNYQECVDYLKNLGPSMLDFEIKSLHPIGGGSYEIMHNFLTTIVYMFNSNINFELAQAYLASFLKSHGRELIERPELLEYLKEVEQAQSISWRRLEEKFFYALGVVGALRNFVS